mgnify:CR=1 FL=1
MPVAVVGVKTRLYCSRRAKKVRPGLASRRQFVGWLQRLRDVAISVLLRPLFLVAQMGRLRSRRWCKLSRHANLPGPPPPYPGAGWCLKRQGGHMQNPFITAPRRAVLITYPDCDELKALLGALE